MSFNRKTAIEITKLSSSQISRCEKSLVVRPSIERAGRGSVRLYSFLDLVLLAAAKMIMDMGVSWKKNEMIVGHLRKAIREVEKPSAGMQFITDGSGIFVLTRDRRVMLDALARGRMVFALPLGKIIGDLKCEVDDACRVRRNAVVVRQKAYDVVLYPDTESGGYCVSCHSLPGCDSQGDTEAEALEMIKDAIKGHLAVAAKRQAKRAVRP